MGTGIVLFVVGAILAFAVNVQTDVVDLILIGRLLMGAGFVVFVIGLALMVRKRRSITTVHSGVSSDGVGVTERRTSVTPDDDGV
jgi:hypothetical protein